MNLDNLKDYSEYINSKDLSDIKQILSGIDKSQFPEKYAIVKNRFDEIISSPELSQTLTEPFEKYHTFRNRVLAGFIDGLVFIPITMLMGYFTLKFKSPIEDAMISLLSNFAYYAYSIFMHGKYGQTFGKMATKVKVLDISENSLSMKQAFIRDAVPLGLLTIGYVLSLIPTTPVNEMPNNIGLHNLLMFLPGMLLGFAHSGWFIAEIVTMLTNKKRRAVHDLLARSVVVKMEI